jgi:hypothetical protein
MSDAIFALIPILALCIPLVAIITKSDLGKALAERLRHGKVPAGPAVPEIDAAVYDELDRLRNDVSELQERLDFAERLLTTRSDDARLPLNRTPA